MRRFSRGNSFRNSQNSGTSANANSAPLTSNAQNQNTTASPGSYSPPLGSRQSAPNGGVIGHNNNTTGGGLHHNSGVNDHSRPVSAASNSSYDYMNRPVNQHQTGGMQQQQQGLHHNAIPMPGSAIGALSRTDQVVLRYFWEDKHADNTKRDLHFLKFPFFPQYPSHTDLMPYCEIYHLVKTSPGASIISLGSANGVYIGFELAQGAQLHIDMDDEWREISHHRIIFKSYESMLRDPASDTTFKSWPKPLTIEYLEDQYRKWMTDLTSFCWIDEPVRDLGSAGLNGGDGRTGSIGGLSDGGVGHDNTLQVRGIGGNGGRDI